MNFNRGSPSSPQPAARVPRTSSGGSVDGSRPTRRRSRRHTRPHSHAERFADAMRAAQDSEGVYEEQAKMMMEELDVDEQRLYSERFHELRGLMDQYASYGVRQVDERTKRLVKEYDSGAAAAAGQAAPDGGQKCQQRLREKEMERQELLVQLNQLQSESCQLQKSAFMGIASKAIKHTHGREDIDMDPMDDGHAAPPPPQPQQPSGFIGGDVDSDDEADQQPHPEPQQQQQQQQQPDQLLLLVSSTRAASDALSRNVADKIKTAEALLEVRELQRAGVSHAERALLQRGVSGERPSLGGGGGGAGGPMSIGGVSPVQPGASPSPGGGGVSGASVTVRASGGEGGYPATVPDDSPLEQS
ncbi:unnamed protein product [Vitrella brassicaformis CCMP3155]|uniref:Uncharacterized protein n=2 Tax=Vitrella brassicaformis TaxID=1169539 RepID=A0A0G4H1Z8_VITBC|nr:unnamed protein product [Vitrella brassicaformis CCMP3155]|eukprot:CEM37665.1 unnamed protein product [Vitrella brassicaformis CCMP3155]